jgi:hypothetical protein
MGQPKQAEGERVMNIMKVNWYMKQFPSQLNSDNEWKSRVSLRKCKDVWNSLQPFGGWEGGEEVNLFLERLELDKRGRRLVLPRFMFVEVIVVHLLYLREQGEASTFAEQRNVREG